MMTTIQVLLLRILIEENHTNLIALIYKIVITVTKSIIMGSYRWIPISASVMKSNDPEAIGVCPVFAFGFNLGFPDSSSERL